MVYGVTYADADAEYNDADAVIFVRPHCQLQGRGPRGPDRSEAGIL